MGAAYCCSDRLLGSVFSCILLTVGAESSELTYAVKDIYMYFCFVAEPLDKMGHVSY